MREKDYGTNSMAGLSSDTHGHSGGTTSSSCSSPATTAPSTPSHASPAYPSKLHRGTTRSWVRRSLIADGHAGLPSESEGKSGSEAAYGEEVQWVGLFGGGGERKTEKVKGEKGRRRERERKMEPSELFRTWIRRICLAWPKIPDIIRKMRHMPGKISAFQKNSDHLSFYEMI